MGRTGRWFGFQHYDVRPDIVALGKGLGNGYPVSAVAMSHEVAERMERGGYRYAQSHQNDPLGCAVASEVIAVMREERLVERGAEAGAAFLQGMQQLVGEHAVPRARAQHAAGPRALGRAHDRRVWNWSGFPGLLPRPTCSGCLRRS
jgi:4-aminobutyrate aminotransferase-like enzyme